MIFRTLIVSLIIFILPACTAPVASEGKSYSLKSSSPNGLLIGSIKYSGGVSGYKVYFKGLNNKQSGYFEAGVGVTLIPIAPSSDFNTISGKLQVTELPPGEYEISRWGVTSGYVNIKQTQPFSIKFKIEPGKATYIGSFVFSVTNTFGLTVIGAKVDFKDEHIEDIKVLRKKYPKFDKVEVFMGLEPGLVKSDIGGASTTYWDIPPVLIPIAK